MMCEPAHSIVQYYGRDDDDTPFGGQIDQESRIKAALGRSFKWGKRILDWFHFSKMGAGHSGVVTAKLTPVRREFGRTDLILPPDTKYENKWWDRAVVLDGTYRSGPAYDQDEALRAATQYAHLSCLGNMSLFRRFLESSLRATTSTYAQQYIQRFLEQVLNPVGRDQLLLALRSVAKVRCHADLVLDPNTRDKAIAKIMGITRKRELFLPHWSDVTELW